MPCAVDRGPFIAAVCVVTWLLTFVAFYMRNNGWGLGASFYFLIQSGTSSLTSFTDAVVLRSVHRAARSQWLMRWFLAVHTGLSVGFGNLNDPDDLSRLVTVANVVLGSSAM